MVKINMIVFFMITLVISYSFENLSIATGFPFGFYNYSPTLGGVDGSSYHYICLFCNRIPVMDAITCINWSIHQKT